MRPIKPNQYEANLYFSDGSFIATDHYVDCCEHNYADWTSLDDTGFWENDFESIELDSWEGGFRINGYAVNCYSSQNGYYSTDLQVAYFHNLGKPLQEIIVDCVIEE